VEVGERGWAREGVAEVATDGVGGTGPPKPTASSPKPLESVQSLDGGGTSALMVTVEVWRRRYALRRALVELADPGSEPAKAEARSAAAGHAALALAEVGDAGGLSGILRPDPAVEPAAWTVACYEIGHVAPTALRDLSDPSEAVKLLAACPDVSHLAAELVVSTTDGLRWTALVRTGSDLRLRLPSDGNASGESHLTGAPSTGAQERWMDQLRAWSTEAEPAPEAAWSLPAAPSVDTAVARALEAAATVHAAEMEAVAIRHAAEMDAASTRHAAALDEARLAGLTPAPARARPLVGPRLGGLLASATAEGHVPSVLRRWASPEVRARLFPNRSTSDAHRRRA
jgi:hypothetical protein